VQQRQPGLIHNLKSYDPKTWISAHEVVDAATVGGAAAMLLKDATGVLQVGKLADIVLLDERTPVLSPMNDAYNMLAYCGGSAAVKHVIVNGEHVVKDGRIVTFDAAAIAQEFRERVDHFPFRHTIDAKTKQDVADCYAFWWDVMDRVTKGE
jgi:5-methylthioadenosine/S-adenosylhomocysteine deaminase